MMRVLILSIFIIVSISIRALGQNEIIPLINKDGGEKTIVVPVNIDGREVMNVIWMMINI